MKGFKRLSVVLLSIITLGTSVLGLTSCDMISGVLNSSNAGFNSARPNNNGGNSSTKPNNSTGSKDDVGNEVVLDCEEIGRAVNLLVGDYTTVYSGAVNIFSKSPELDEPLKIAEQETEVTFAEGLESYMEERSSKITDKFGMEISAGVDKLAKVSMGYDMEVSKQYVKKTYAATKSIFYDMDYYYIYGQVGIKEYKNLNKLRQTVTAAFKEDAQKVSDGTMSAKSFIDLYGTHIVTAGIYGATFNAHYDMIGDTQTVDKTFKNDIEDTINATIGANIYGVDLGEKITSGQAIAKSELTSQSNEDKQSTFKAKAKGGTATPPEGNSLEAFARNCSEWAKNLNDNYVLIDVPDDSLYFVWEFLGDEYQETKEILYDYFYATCDLNNQKLRDKMGDFYSHFVTFDEETGTLNVDFSDLQTVDKADLSGLLYKTEKDNSGIDFDTTDTNGNNTLKVYSMVKGQEVEKVVFRGNYQRKNSYGAKPETKFSNLNIQFDKYWDKDIVVEFDSFAFEAPDGQNALDFSEVESKNITINVVNAAYMRGSDGAWSGQNGWIGINAPEINLTITGDNFEVIGGNGRDGASGNGGNGAIGIVAGDLIVDTTGKLTVTGGNGGNGATGYVGSDGSGNNAPGSNGGNGGNGGNGASAVKCVSITISETSFVTLIAGNGGNGGAGGRGGNGTRDSAPWSNGNNKGGNGGNGGNGGFCSKVLIANSTAINTEIVLQEGTVGLGGVGGDGGNGGPGNTSFIAGSGGAGGSGGIGGLNGDGVTRASNGKDGQKGG